MSDGIETGPTPEETLQLLEAFNRITDPEIKWTVIRLAQQLASGNPHFASTLARLIRKH